MRASLRFYRALVVGRIYEFVEPADLKSIFTYTCALRQCLDSYLQFSIKTENAQTEKEYYALCTRVDLRQHVQVFEFSGDTSEVVAIEQLLLSILDTLWSSSVPA